MASPARYIMAQQRRWLMRVAKAMGRYLVNGYAALKLQTGEGITLSPVCSLIRGK